MDNAFGRLAMSVALGVTVTSGEVASARARVFTGALDAHTEVSVRQQSACGEATVEASRARADYRRAARGRDAEDMSSVADDLFTELQEISTGLQTHTSEIASDPLGRRWVAEENRAVPSFIDACATTGWPDRPSETFIARRSGY